MLNLIRADFYKAIHGKVLKVCFLMMTGWIFLCAYAQKATIGMREYLVGTEVSANYWDSFFNYYPVATVYKGNIIKNLIMDCQSYTKYRPNETTGGIFVSWRRKEELPTGA